MEQARANLNAAKVNQAANIYFAASWFAQQAAMVALKALSIEQHAPPPPKTHNFVFVGGQLSVPQRLNSRRSTPHSTS